MSKWSALETYGLQESQFNHSTHVAGIYPIVLNSSLTQSNHLPIFELWLEVKGDARELHNYTCVYVHYIIYIISEWLLNTWCHLKSWFCCEINLIWANFEFATYYLILSISYKCFQKMFKKSLDFSIKMTQKIHAFDI
jgi:hypothetical protein